MDLEQRVAELERRTNRYRNALVIVLSLCATGFCFLVFGPSVVTAEEKDQSRELVTQLISDYKNGVVRARHIQFIDSDGATALLMTSEPQVDGDGLALLDAEGNLFYRVFPGGLNLRYPKRKGGGSFLWAGPGFSAGGSTGEFQVISENLESGQGPAVSINVGITGEGYIKLSDPKAGTERTYRP